MTLEEILSTPFGCLGLLVFVFGTSLLLAGVTLVAITVLRFIQELIEDNWLNDAEPGHLVFLFMTIFTAGWMLVVYRFLESVL